MPNIYVLILPKHWAYSQTYLIFEVAFYTNNNQNLNYNITSRIFQLFNTMKKTLIFLIFVTIGFQAQAQFHKYPELKKIDEQLDVALDSSAKHMIMFILTKNESDYDMAISTVNKADSLNKYFLKEAGDKKLKLDEYQIEGRRDEIKQFFAKKLKAEILAEKKKSEHVKFRHHKYEVGPKALSYYEKFIEFLPRN